jgi:hypothetical protein
MVLPINDFALNDFVKNPRPRHFSEHWKTILSTTPPELPKVPSRSTALQNPGFEERLLVIREWLLAKTGKPDPITNNEYPIN